MDIGWMGALILGLCLPLILLALVAAFLPKCRNPVIKDQPQPDSRRDAYRNFTVGQGDAK